jgi:hypothetical protein
MRKQHLGVSSQQSAIHQVERPANALISFTAAAAAAAAADIQ